ncbi:MAG: acetolactate synthase large subunit [Methanobacteriaceae archaeon]|jgi:acetolactate synthase-1/2/3 large subunit|nr:acetolactate synthase large subunit [Methanobacteriaceae archaeon]
MRGGEAIIKALKEQGVDTIFGYPGGQVIPFYDMLYGDDLRHILVRHEQCAAHAADGYARASGKVGVCLATSGPGATNLVTGIATAFMDSSPILAITGQVPTHLIGNDAFQEADIMGITMPITKHSYQVNDVDLIPSLIKNSFEISSSGRPGPVLIDVPKEIQEKELKKYSYSLIDTPGYKPTTKGNIKQIRKACDEIKKAKNPIILSGGGVIISNASEELKTLSNLIKAPVMTTLLGKGSVNENDEHCLGMVGMHGRKVANVSVNKSDCLIAIGCRFSDRTTGKIDEFAPNAQVIHIDIDPAEIGKNLEVDIPIVGDAKNVLKSLVEELKKDSSKFKSEEWFKNTKSLKNKYIPKTTYNHCPLKPQEVMKEISESLNPESIMTTDVGLNQMWAAHFHHAQKPRKFITSGGLGTMGFGFPSAIGAKVACPEDNVVAVTGDGGFLMVCQELATIKEYDIPIIIALLNNRKLGMVYQWQNLLYDERCCQTDLGQTPDFVKLGESFGINSLRVSNPGETKEAMNNALKDGESILLDIIVDENEFLPMIPPGSCITEYLGEYKLENE